MTLSCVWTIPQSRATEIAVSMLSPYRGFKKSEGEQGYHWQHEYTNHWSIKGISSAYTSCLNPKRAAAWLFPITRKKKKKKESFLPVTIRVRMLACRNWYKTLAVSPFILFCMMIKPRNSMLVSITSLKAWRQKILHQWKKNHWLLPITTCKLVHRRWQHQHLHGRHGSKSYLSFWIQLLQVLHI